MQAQLGHRSEQSTHKYAHLGSGAQKRLIETLKPKSAPHEAARRSHVNVGSTSEAEASTSDLQVNGARGQHQRRGVEKRKARFSPGLFSSLRGEDLNLRPSGYEPDGETIWIPLTGARSPAPFGATPGVASKVKDDAERLRNTM